MAGRRTVPEQPRGDGPVSWLALGQAAKYLGVSESTARKWADQGRLPAFSTPGGHRRFRVRDLDDFLASRRVTPVGHRGSVVLIVDDDERRRALVRFGLEREGYEVREAANAADGLAALDAEPPDLILLDVLMKDMDGVEMLCRLSERHGLESMPVVMYGGDRDGAAPRPGLKTLDEPDPTRLVEAAKQLLSTPVSS